jgi:hypothetical protein
MRAAIKRFDRFLRKVSGVFEFTDEAWCIFRLQLRDAPHDIRLSDGTFVGRGEPILGLHFWNEQIPALGPEGADVAWGARVARLAVRSMRAIAAWVQAHPEMIDRHVLGGATVLLDMDTVDGPANLIRRLGFEIFPFRSPLGRFGEFWENAYTWSLMWAYNSPSVNDRPPVSMRRTVIWMPVEDLLARYGASRSVVGSWSSSLERGG